MRPSARIAAMIATAVALACLPAAARAAMTGNELSTYCAAADTNSQYFNPANFGVCASFVEAIANALASYSIYGWRACFPANRTRGQEIDVVRRYLDQHPEKRHNQAGSLIAEALAEAFPCKP